MVRKIKIDNLMNTIKNSDIVAKLDTRADITKDNMPTDFFGITQQIIELKEKIQENYWLMGQRLAYIYDNRIYPNNYNNFSSFCADRLSISYSYALRIIDVYKKFSYEQSQSISFDALLELKHIKDEETRNIAVEELSKEKFTSKDIRSIASEIREAEKQITDDGIVIADNKKQRVDEFVKELVAQNIKSAEKSQMKEAERNKIKEIKTIFQAGKIQIKNNISMEVIEKPSKLRIIVELEDFGKEKKKDYVDKIKKLLEK